jgi:hypothetical protein
MAGYRSGGISIGLESMLDALRSLSPAKRFVALGTFRGINVVTFLGQGRGLTPSERHGSASSRVSS